LSGVATVTAGAFRDVPRRQGGGSAAGIRFSSRLSGVATATAGAFRDQPPPQAGDPSAGIRFCGFLLADKRQWKLMRFGGQ